MWLKLTKPDNSKIVVNFDRFDVMETSPEGYTRISSVIGDDVDEIFTIYVKEPLKEIHEWLGRGGAGEEE